MTDASTITVVFKLSAKILAGLSSGAYERVGGVIRQTGDKKVIAWLTEGGAARPNASGSGLDPGMLSEALGDVQGAMKLANGLGALNLAVNTAGFAMIRRQLDGLSQQLGTISADMRAIQKETAFINGLAIAGIRAEIDTALEHADRARRTNDQARYQDAKSALMAIRNRVRHAAEFVLKSRLAVDKHTLFRELVEAGAVLAFGEALCDEVLEGLKAAVETLTLASATVRALTSEFDRQRRDFSNDPVTMLRMGAPGRAALAELHGRLVETGNQVEGAAESVRLRGRLGLDAEGWKRLTQPVGSGSVTFLLLEENGPVVAAACDARAQ